MSRKSLRIANRGQEALLEYKYTPLENANEWIRLLRFLPNPTGASLRACMFHVKLCDAPPYRALSYTWGASSDVHAEIELCTSPSMSMAIVSTTIKSMSPMNQSRCNTKTYPDQWTRAACDMNLERCGVGKVPEAYLRSVVEIRL